MMDIYNQWITHTPLQKKLPLAAGCPKGAGHKTLIHEKPTVVGTMRATAQLPTLKHSEIA